MKPKLRVPSFRDWLLGVHEDLLAIHSRINPSAEYRSSRLTEFERLVLTLEDRRFFSHHGVSWRSLAREALKPLVLRRPRGASTIDMQLVRTATGNYERSMQRKLREIVLSHLIQFRYSKIVILRSYLEIAYFGTGLQGADSAALGGMLPDDLTGYDAALLASHLVFPRPRDMNEAWKKRISRRANYINSVNVRYKKRFDKIERSIFR
jgi:membrane peptidoglycan carboxypeptidase